MKCRYCKSSALRRSRLRTSDIPRLLMFQLPVRCRGCHMRIHVGAHQAFKLKGPGKAREQRQDMRPTESHGTAPGPT